MSIAISEAIDRFLEDRRGKRASPATIRHYMGRLSFWHSWHIGHGYSPDLVDLGVAPIAAYLLYLLEEHTPYGGIPSREHGRLSPYTVDSTWRIVTALWHYLEEQDLLTPAQVREFRCRGIPRPEMPEDIRPTYDTYVLDRLLEVAQVAPDRGNGKNNLERAARNRAILLVLYESGMRNAELCGLRDDHVWIEDRRALVTGKGDKQRWVFWGPRGAHALVDYLELRSGPPDGWLFRSFGGRGMKNIGGPVCPDSVRHMVRALAQRAKVRIPKGSPVHALRHTFAHTALDAGIDSLHLQQLLGHSDVETTARYVRENPNRLRKIHERIWTPRTVDGEVLP